MEDLHIMIVFAIMVIALLGLDLFVMGKNPHKVTMKEALIWTVIFVSSALGFAGYVYYDLGHQPAMDFLNAYAIEKVLSVDNLFVFILVFGYFKVPKEYHHKVLFWGILGAIIMRFIFIYVGIELLSFTEISLYGHNINIVILLFGGFLLYAGIKSAIEALGDGDDEEEDFSKSAGAKFIKWLFPRVTENYEGDKFFVKKEIWVNAKDVNGVEDKSGTNQMSKIIRFATPLLVVVGVVEFTDLLFAVDSIPAIFSVSKDPFILFSSNIFAILGLRSMYFLLAGLLPLFRYLNHGLAFILAFIGVKMLIAPIYHIDSTISLFIVLGVLVLSIGISLIANKVNPIVETSEK